jgi:hypothetical protein
MRGMDKWEHVAPILRDRAYGMLDSQPESLLETDAASALPADVYFARLIGLDDEIVQDGWRLPGGTAPTPILRVPLAKRMTLATADDPSDLRLNVADYRLQSGSSVTPICAPLSVPGVAPGPRTLVTRVGWLRYRRRL